MFYRHSLPSPPKKNKGGGKVVEIGHKTPFSRCQTFFFSHLYAEAMDDRTSSSLECSVSHRILGGNVLG